MSCVCGGLGVYVDGNVGGYELAVCVEHAPPVDPSDGLGADDLAAVRVDECLEALASICNLVQPAEERGAEQVAEAVAAVLRRLGVVVEREEARAPLDLAALFTRPRAKIQGIRQVEDEAALLGHVYIFGVMHHAWFVEVEERDGDQVAVDDPYDRLEEFQQLDADAGRFQTVEVPGFPGEYVLVIYPAGE
jgi:hypothetical protein